MHTCECAHAVPGSAHTVVYVRVRVGGVCLAGLRRLAGFQILRGRETLGGVRVAAVAATILGSVIVCVDLIFTYPADLNVPMPDALLFYPAIGLVAEVVFHLLPLTVVLLALRAFRGDVSGVATTVAILIVAAAEPGFQVVFGGEPGSWRSLATFANVFLVAAAQLFIYRRYDFVSMFALRLLYYSYWHIIWGVLRLRLLF